MKTKLKKATKDIFKDMTWNCHVCGKERPDNKIDVVSGQYRGFKDAQINIRYCNDNTDCQIGATNAVFKGEFPVTGKIEPCEDCKLKFIIKMLVCIFFMIMLLVLTGKYL